MINKRLYFIFTLIMTAVLLSGCLSKFQKYEYYAERGNPDAQALLGRSYLNGGIVTLDYQKALLWLRRATSGGSLLGMYYLGSYYGQGLGKETPNEQRAERFYLLAFDGVKKKARGGDMNCALALADMYYYGRGAEKDLKTAHGLYEFCADRAFYPAATMLGIIYFKGNGVKRDIKTAKRFLFKAADREYPRAQYYLSEVYVEMKNPAEADKWLQAAAKNNYPPAMYKLGMNYKAKGDSETARILIMKAANAGWAPAQYEAAQYSSDREIKLDWIRRAAEHSYVPAMLEFTTLLAAGVDRDPAKIMVILELARKIRPDNQAIISKIVDLDHRVGLYFPVKFCWYHISGGENMALAYSGINRIVDGFRAGIKGGSREIFMKELKEAPLSYFMNNDWFQIFENRMPLQWAAEIFVKNRKAESERPGFWLTYGICAGLAGQGGIQAYAAFELKKIAEKISQPTDRQLLEELAALLKANSMILLGQDDEAYSYLLTRGQLKHASSPYMVNFVNFWCAPLLKDKRKLSVATGLEMSALAAYYKPEKQKFFDFQLNRILGKKPPVNEPAVDFSRKK